MWHLIDPWTAPPLFRVLEIPENATSLANEKDFEVKAYGIAAAQEQTRPPRPVKLALVQNAIILPTTAPVKDQVSTTKRQRLWNIPM